MRSGTINRRQKPATELLSPINLSFSCLNRKQISMSFTYVYVPLETVSMDRNVNVGVKVLGMMEDG